MATNNFSQTSPEILAPYTRAVDVTPDDDNDLSEVTRGIHAHGAGSHHDLSVILQGDDNPVVIAIAKGDILPLRVRRVRATDTTATTIVALY